MHVYFVRHGSTELGDNNIHQSPNTPLSPKGKEEAQMVAEALRAFLPDVLLSSEYTRALETARIVGARIGLLPVTNGLFYEIERPSHLFHTRVFHPKTFLYLLNIFWYRKDQTRRYFDAENFFDVKSRAERAIAYLESLSQTHASVVIVSHTVFLHILLNYLSHRRVPTVLDILRILYKSEHMKNGQIIHAEYTKCAHTEECGWKVFR